MTLDDWQKINSFALWISSFGSIFAATVALYLAGRSEKEKAFVRETWVLNKDQYTYGVQITNISTIPLYIDSVEVQCTRNSEVAVFHLSVDSQKMLEYGQTLTTKTKSDYCNTPKLITVTTSTGKEFEIQPSKRFTIGLDGKQKEL